MDLITLASDAAFQAASSAGKTSFWTSDIGSFIKALLRAIGILVVLAGVFKAIKPALSGKAGEVVKTVVVTLILAAFCFQPELISDGITLASDIVGKVLKSIGQVGG